MSRVGSEIERIADFVGMVKYSPRTTREIADRLGVGQPAVRNWIQIFRDKGHLRENGAKKVGKAWVTVWSWQE